MLGQEPPIQRRSERPTAKMTGMVFSVRRWLSLRQVRPSWSMPARAPQKRPVHLGLTADRRGHCSRPRL